MLDPELAKYGVGGLAVLILGFAIYIFKTSQKTINNHISHSTEALNNNSRMIEKMSDSNNYLAETIKDLKEEMRHLKK